MELTNNLLKFSKIKNLEDFQIAKDYFRGNLSGFTSAKEKEYKKQFDDNYSLETMQLLLEIMLSDQKNIGTQKYEFALRNIEVTFSEYLSFVDMEKANIYTMEHLKAIKQNIPPIFPANTQLGSNLKILAKPFSEVLRHSAISEYVWSESLDTIYSYLEGGNLERVKSLIKAYGIEEDFSDSDLEKIYVNLCRLCVD